MFPIDILEDNHIGLTQPQLEQLSEKYNIMNKGRLSYLDFLQHFVLILKPQINARTPVRPLHLFQCC